MDGAALDGNQGSIQGLTHYCNLWPGTWFTVVVPQEAVVSAAGGLPLSQDVEWTFKTDPETVPPENMPRTESIPEENMPAQDYQPSQDEDNKEDAIGESINIEESAGK